MADAAPPRCSSDPAPPPLRALALGTLAPMAYSERAQLAAWLHSIDHVHVRETVKRADGKRYVMDVYMKLPASHLPTAAPPVVRASRRQDAPPEITTERGFSEFTKLLNDFYYLAEKDHGFLPCTFCPLIVDYVFQDKRVPRRVHQWLRSDAAVCEVLTAFINSLLEVVCQVPDREHENDCPGKQQVPQMMKRLLCGDGNGTELSIPRAAP